MGMDVVGVNPINETGKYFRNNVWWWRPLWDYCVSVYPPCEKVSGHYNDGDGMDLRHSLQLANVLRKEISSGRTAQYAENYKKFQETVPDEQCQICDGTGQRPDGLYGVEWKGKGCNGCDGKGTKRPWVTEYPFTVENVEEFANFLDCCGGFQIH